MKSFLSAFLLLTANAVCSAENIVDTYANAVLGDPEASAIIAEALRQGRGVKKDQNLAIGWYKRAADGGFAPAMNWLALMHMSGDTKECNDYSAAYLLLERAAKLGNASATHNLARIYHYGLGRKADIDRAIELYKRASSNGAKESLFELAKALLKRGASADRAEAASLLEQISVSDAKAAELLGHLYQNGIGVEASALRAAEMYLLSASLGGVRSKVEYYFLVREKMVPDREKGLSERLLMEAVSESDAVALEEAGVVLMSKPNAKNSLASEYFARAAIHGSSSAQYYLGIHYHDGIGVKKNVDAGLALINAAANAGMQDAKNWINARKKD